MRPILRDVQPVNIEPRPERSRGAFKFLIWAVPIVLYAPDACAWGLYTHMYFAQLVVWSVPLTDPRFRKALARFPDLFLAASCLPDVSLFSRPMRVPALRTTHQWRIALGLLRDAETDADRAMALGYATHLLTDIVAHNHFVPAHERIWFRGGMTTHAISEWAMDAHVSPQLFVQPTRLVARYGATLTTFAQSGLGIEPRAVGRALACLLYGEQALRRSRLPQLIYGAARRADHTLARRFDEYIRETSRRLLQLNRLLGGEVPIWMPEIEGEDPRRHEPSAPRSAYLALLPPDFFRSESRLRD